MRNFLFIFFLLGIQSAALHAQDSRLIWQKTIGGIGDDEVNDLVADAEGNTYVLSTVQDLNRRKVFVSKLNSNGTELWNQTISGNSDEVGSSLLLSDKQELIVLGATTSTQGLGAVSSGYTDVFIAKLTTDGEILGVKTYGGSYFEQPASILQKSNGNFVVTASTWSHDLAFIGNNGQSDIWLFEVNASGQIVWSELYGGSDEEMATETIELTTGELLLIGTSATFDGDFTQNHGDLDIIVYKTDANGKLEWKQIYGGFYSEYAADLLELPNGDCLIAGSTFSDDGNVDSNAGGLDAWLLRLNVDGDLLWNETYGSYGNESVVSLQANGDGFLILGTSNSSVLNNEYSHGNQDFWLYELNESMEVVHQNLFGASGFDFGTTMLLQNGGDILMGGSTNSNDGLVVGNQGKKDGWLLKISRSHFLASSQAVLHPNPTDGIVYINEIAVGARLRVIDLNGNDVVQPFESAATAQILDLSAVPAGVYIVEIESEAGQETHRIVRF